MSTEVKIGPIRQGDVILRPMKAEIPTEGIIEVKDKVLARSSSSGHTHGFALNAPVNVISKDEKQYIEVLEPSLLLHIEHRDLLIPVGNYEVLKQKELSLSDEIQDALD